MRFGSGLYAPLWCLLLLCAGTLQAQPVREPLRLAVPAGPKPFQTVLALDKRSHHQIGVVQKGVFNSATEVAFEGSLAGGLALFFGQDTVSSNPQAVLLLQDFFLSERTGTASEFGFLKLHLRLFCQARSDRYTEALSIDTTYRVRAPGLDVTRALKQFVSDQFGALAAGLRVRQPASSASDYSFEELTVLDSLEKLVLPAYTVTRLQPGVYKDYTAFKNNTPEDIPLRIDWRKRQGYLVYDTRVSPYWKGRIMPDSVYAVVTDSQMLKTTIYGFYPLERVQNSYYFSGYSAAYEVPNNSGVDRAVFGDLIMDVTSKQPLSPHSKYVTPTQGRYRLDHRSGRSILVDP